MNFRVRRSATEVAGREVEGPSREGFRMPADAEPLNTHTGRRPKDADEGTRGGLPSYLINVQRPAQSAQQDSV